MVRRPDSYSLSSANENCSNGLSHAVKSPPTGHGAGTSSRQCKVVEVLRRASDTNVQLTDTEDIRFIRWQF